MSYFSEINHVYFSAITANNLLHRDLIPIKLRSQLYPSQLHFVYMCVIIWQIGFIPTLCYVNTYLSIAAQENCRLLTQYIPDCAPDD